jgi:putative ABC transport system permease protein
VPGIRSAALVNTLPLTGAVAKRSLELEGHTVPPSETSPLFWLHVVSPAYFDVMQIELAAGRRFADADLTGRPAVAVMARSAARRFWPGENPIGKRVRFAGEQEWRTIVGVVADVRAYDLTRSIPEFMAGALYVPHAPNATLEDGGVPTEMSLVVRTTLSPSVVGSALRRLPAVSGEVVTSDVRSMEAVLSDALAAPAATTSLLVTMAGVALVLGCVGVYGVLSFLVLTTTRDLGIRVALGAQRRDVFWLVIRQGLVLCVAGIALGVAGALAATRWLASELYGVSPTDPATYAAVALIVSLVTMAACYVPTRRAMAVDPLFLLRGSTAGQTRV